MFNAVCIMVVGLLAAYAVKEYKLISVVMFMEFTLHEVAAQFGLIETRLLNPVLIYLVYIIIQVLVLAVMYSFQTHFIIASLVFFNLTYNFVTILQHIGIHMWDPIFGYYLNFHAWYKDVAQIIMTLEILYLLGINSYVGNYIRKCGILDTNHIDRLFCIRRRFPIRGMA